MPGDIKKTLSNSSWWMAKHLPKSLLWGVAALFIMVFALGEGNENMLSFVNSTQGSIFEVLGLFLGASAFIATVLALRKLTGDEVVEFFEEIVNSYESFLEGAKEQGQAQQHLEKEFWAYAKLYASQKKLFIDLSAQAEKLKLGEKATSKFIYNHFQRIWIAEREQFYLTLIKKAPKKNHQAIYKELFFSQDLQETSQLLSFEVKEPKDIKAFLAQPKEIYKPDELNIKLTSQIAQFRNDAALKKQIVEERLFSKKENIKFNLIGFKDEAYHYKYNADYYQFRCSANAYFQSSNVLEQFLLAQDSVYLKKKKNINKTSVEFTQDFLLKYMLSKKIDDYFLQVIEQLESADPVNEQDVVTQVESITNGISLSIDQDVKRFSSQLTIIQQKKLKKFNGLLHAYYLACEQDEEIEEELKEKKRKARLQAMIDEFEAQNIAKKNSLKFNNLYSTLAYIDFLNKHNALVAKNACKTLKPKRFKWLAPSTGQVLGVSVALADGVMGFFNGSTILPRLITTFVAIAAIFGLSLSFILITFPLWLMVGLGALFAASVCFAQLFLSRPAIVNMAEGVDESLRPGRTKLKKKNILLASPIVLLSSVGCGAFVFAALATTFPLTVPFLVLIIPVSILIGLEIFSFRGSKLIQEIGFFRRLLAGKEILPWHELSPMQKVKVAGALFLAFCAASSSGCAAFFGIMSLLAFTPMAMPIVIIIAAAFFIAGFLGNAAVVTRPLLKLCVGPIKRDITATEEFEEVFNLTAEEDASWEEEIEDDMGCSSGKASGPGSPAYLSENPEGKKISDLKEEDHEQETEYGGLLDNGLRQQKGKLPGKGDSKEEEPLIFSEEVNVEDNFNKYGKI